MEASRTTVPDSVKVPGKGPVAEPFTMKGNCVGDNSQKLSEVNVSVLLVKVSPASDGNVPLPLSKTVAVAAGFLLVAFKLAVTAPVVVGTNCTATVHESPGSRTVAVHVSPMGAIANSEEPARVITGAAGEPPVFINVNVCAPVFPGSTDPKSYGDGENVRTGGPDAALAPLAPNANAATHKQRNSARPPTTHQSHPPGPKTPLTNSS